MASGSGYSMILPRVTQILEATGFAEDFSVVPPATLAAGARRGSLVHQVIESITYGFRDQIAPEIDGYITGYQRFLSESKFEAKMAEFEVRHEVWRYRGHPDLFGWFSTVRSILDVKTGIIGPADLQLVAYVDAWNHQHPTEQVTSAAVLSLRADGTYRFNEIELEVARPTWYAALTVYHERARRHGKLAVPLDQSEHSLNDVADRSNSVQGAG